MSAAVVLATVVAATACSTDAPAPAGPDRSSEPTPSATTTPGGATSTTVDFGDGPQTTGFPDCAELLPGDLAAGVVPDVRPVDVVADVAHVAGSEAFLPAAGGVTCSLSNGVAPLDDPVPGGRDQPVYEGVSLTVLPAGGAALTAHREFDGSGAPTDCTASDAARVYCDADVPAGDAWVSLSTTRLQDDDDATPEQAQPAFDALLATVVDHVATTRLGTAEGDGGADDGSITTCDAGNVNAVTGTTLSVGPFPNSSAPPETTDFARNRVGADSCVFVSTDEGSGYTSAGALYTHLPGGGWVAEQRLAAGTIDRGDRLDVPGLGAGDAAWRTCDETACSVDVVHDGDWTHWLLFADVAPDTSTAIAGWVGTSVAD